MEKASQSLAAAQPVQPQPVRQQPINEFSFSKDTDNDNEYDIEDVEGIEEKTEKALREIMRRASAKLGGDISSTRSVDDYEEDYEDEYEEEDEDEVYITRPGGEEVRLRPQHPVVQVQQPVHPQPVVEVQQPVQPQPVVEVPQPDKPR